MRENKWLSFCNSTISVQYDESTSRSLKRLLIVWRTSLVLTRKNRNLFPFAQKMQMALEMMIASYQLRKTPLRWLGRLGPNHKSYKIEMEEKRKLSACKHTQMSAKLTVVHFRGWELTTQRRLFSQILQDSRFVCPRLVRSMVIEQRRTWGLDVGR